MSSLTFDRFEFGLDVRKGSSASDANRLRVLTNAYVTTGRQLKKRPCLHVYTTLSAGTKGLTVGKGKLQTFYGGTGSISHADPLFEATRVMHPGTPALEIAKVHFGDVYDGYVYVVTEYTDGSVWHHWVNDPGAWAATTAYAVGTFRRPTTANGFIYEATAIAGTGTSAAGEPAWPTTPGATVIDNPGANQITWTCRCYAILDSNNPKSISCAKLADRIFAIGDEIVAYCVLGNPRDWTTTGDAGFLPVGLKATGNVDPNAIGVFRNQLAVMFNDATQLWNIDADPDLMAINEIVPNVGTTYPKSLSTVAQDMFFLTPSGYRSIGILTNTGNYQDSDVGNPIDDLVQAEILPTDDPLAVWYGNGGQSWWIFGTYAHVYTFSRTGKISSWSRYEFPFSIEAAAVYAGVLYLRSGDVIYTLDKSIYSDGGTPPTVSIELPYMNLKSPGSLKQIIGFDVNMRGTADISFKYDPNDETAVTIPVTLSGNTQGETMQPLELCCVALAPVFSNALDENFELYSITIYYHDLGPV